MMEIDMSDDKTTVLRVLENEYEWHSKHLRHVIDKSFQMFDVHLVVVPALLTVVALIVRPEFKEARTGILLLIAVFAFLWATPALNIMVRHRYGYVLHMVIANVIRSRMSSLVRRTLDSEVKLLGKGPKLLTPGSGWFSRIFFIMLSSTVVVTICTFLALSDPAFTLSDIPPLALAGLGFLYILCLFVFLVTVSLAHGLHRRFHEYSEESAATLTRLIGKQKMEEQSDLQAHNITGYFEFLCRKEEQIANLSARVLTVIGTVSFALIGYVSCVTTQWDILSFTSFGFFIASLLPICWVYWRSWDFEPHINPTNGAAGTPFTITDSHGRIRPKDITVFYQEDSNATTGTRAENVVISDEGTTLRANVPQGLTEGIQYFVSVHQTLDDQSRFGKLAFQVTHRQP